jgi:hypothetical protein
MNQIRPRDKLDAEQETNSGARTRKLRACSTHLQPKSRWESEADSRKNSSFSEPNALGEAQDGPRGKNQTEIWARLPQWLNTANKKKLEQRTSSRENALKTSALTGHRTSTVD